MIHPDAAGSIVFWPVDASTTGKRLAASGLVPSGFVRFVVAKRDPGTGLELGVFQVAYMRRADAIREWPNYPPSLTISSGDDTDLPRLLLHEPVDQ